MSHTPTPGTPPVPPTGAHTAATVTPAAIVPVLAQTLLSDNDTRNRAEKALFAARGAPGFLMSLLTVATTPGSGPGVALQAAVQFKNACASGWRNDPDRPSIFPEAEKAPVRAAILEAAVMAPSSAALTALASPVAYMARHDFPDRWPDLPGMLVGNLKSGDQRRIAHITMVIRRLFSTFEFIRPAGRAPFDMLIDAIMPVLYDMLTALMPMHNLESAVLIKAVVKTYMSSVVMTLNATMRKPESLGNWANLLATLAEKPLPEAATGLEPRGQPVDLEEREQWPWWKAKKHAAMAKLLHRYGNSKYVEHDLKDAARFISQTLGPRMLGATMTAVANMSTGEFVADGVQKEMLADCTEHAHLWKLMKPHREMLIWKVVLPVCSYNRRDHALWTEDPEDYVRRECDSMAAYNDDRTGARNSATLFLLQLFKVRYGATFPQFWTEVNKRLTVYLAQPVESRNYPEKDGLLLMMGAAFTVLSKKYKAMMEMFMVQHVLPELKPGSPSFVRARAIWFFVTCIELRYTNVAALNEGITSVVQAMDSPELPLRYMAASQFRYLFRNPACKAYLRPQLGGLLDKFFTLLTDLGVDDVVSSLEALISEFEAEMANLAQPLCCKLVDLFMAYSKESGGDDEDMEMAAMNCLECLGTVLMTCKDRPDMFALVEDPVMPCLRMIMSPDGENLEYFENGLSVLSFMAAWAPLTPNMWGVFRLLIHAYNKYAFDYVAEILHPVDQFIRRGADQFLAGDPASGTNYVEEVWGMMLRTEAAGGETDMCHGTRFLWSLLYHLHGRIDPMVKMMIGHMLGRIHAAKTNYYRVAIASVVLATCMYNASLALATLQEAKALVGFVDFLAANVTDCKVDDDQQVWALGIASILRVPPASLPADLMPKLPALFNVLVKVLDMLTSDEREDQETVVGSDDSDEDDDDDGIVAAEEFDGDYLDPEEVAYAQSLAQLTDPSSAELQAGAQAIAVEEYLRESSYAGPSNHVDAVKFFAETMAALSSHHKAAYDALVATLGPAGELFQMLMKKGMESDKVSVLYAPVPPELAMGAP